MQKSTKQNNGKNRDENNDQPARQNCSKCAPENCQNHHQRFPRRLNNPPPGMNKNHRFQEQGSGSFESFKSRDYSCQNPKHSCKSYQQTPSYTNPLAAQSHQVLRIQGGGTFVRDVWGILALAAEEIEKLYADCNCVSCLNTRRNAHLCSSYDRSDGPTQYQTAYSCRALTCNECPGVENDFNESDQDRSSGSITRRSREPCRGMCCKRNITFSSPVAVDRRPICNQSNGTFNQRRGSRQQQQQNGTFNITDNRRNDDRNGTFDLYGSGQALGKSKTISNATFIMSDKECLGNETVNESFSPHPALASTPHRCPRTPPYRNYTDSDLDYSDSVDLSNRRSGNCSNCQRIDQENSCSRRIQRPPNETFDVQPKGGQGQCSK